MTSDFGTSPANVARSATLRMWIPTPAVANRKPRPSDAEIRELFHQRLTNREIAERLTTTESTISNRLHVLGLTRRRTGAKLSRWEQRIIEYQKAHPSNSFAKTARHFHTWPSRVGPFLKAAGCKTPFPPKGPKPPQIGMYTGISSEQMVQAFEEDKKLHGGVGSPARVAKQLGLGSGSRSFVAKVLREAGCRTKRQPRPVDWDKIIRHYNKANESMQDLAAEFKIGGLRLRREFEKRGVTIRSKTAWLSGWHAENREARQVLKRMEEGRKSAAQNRSPKERIRIGQAVDEALPTAVRLIAAKADLPKAARENYARFKDALSSRGFLDEPVIQRALAAGSDPFERTFTAKSNPLPLARHIVADTEKMDFDLVRRHDQMYRAGLKRNSAA